MNAEQSVLAKSAMLYDELVELMDERTFETLERRRKTETVRRRGWLVRRMLLGADLIGLVAVRHRAAPDRAAARLARRVGAAARVVRLLRDAASGC